MHITDCSSSYGCVYVNEGAIAMKPCLVLLLNKEEAK